MTYSKRKFLITLGSAIRNGAVKTIQQAMAFAKREFGEIDKKFVDDIVNVFKKEGKTKKGDVVPIKKKTEAEKDIADIQKSIDDLDAAEAEADAFSALDKRTKDIAKGDIEGTGVESLMTSMNKLKKKINELKKTSQKTLPEDIMKEIMKGQKVMAENYKTGNIRTAVRWFMRSEADAGRLKISADDLDSLKVYGQTTESDPINIFRRYYGEGALESVDEIGDVFRQGESFKHYEELL